jgi:hypothetical protein
MFVSAQDFLDAFHNNAGPVVHRVDLPGDKFAFVLQRTAHEVSEYEISTSKGNSPESVRERIVAFATCDKDGNLLFDPKHLTAIGQLPSTVTDPLVHKIRELHWPEMATIEDARKNSESGTSGA